MRDPSMLHSGVAEDFVADQNYMPSFYVEWQTVARSIPLRSSSMQVRSLVPPSRSNPSAPSQGFDASGMICQFLSHVMQQHSSGVAQPMNITYARPPASSAPALADAPKMEPHDGPSPETTTASPLKSPSPLLPTASPVKTSNLDILNGIEATVGPAKGKGAKAK